jgi:hypothetical protein
MERRQVRQVLAGSALVALGVLFLGDRIDLWEGWSFWRLGPIILIIIGLGQVIGPRRRADATWGWVLMACAGVLLMDTMNVLPLRQSWPLFVVINGVAVLTGALNCRRRPRGESESSHVVH